MLTEDGPCEVRSRPSSWVARRRAFPHTGARLPPTDARAQDATIQLPAITVIGTTPLPGAEIPREKVPAANYVLSGEELRPNEVANVTDALETRIGGVNLNQAQGNPFQPNLTYRGFEASPLAGNPQGLAVYVNGSRFNQPFGDTVNWDLIPSIAIHRMVLEGSNPAFGLNALGGSISVEMKNGFNYQGAEMELMGGSFGRINGSLQYGRQIDNVGVYAAVTGLREDGWRQFSPSRLAQFYGDIGWRGSRGEMHFNVIGASNSLTGNGTAPVELLAVDRSAVFTHPDQTRNNYARLQLSGKYELTDTWSLQGNAYYGRLSQRTKNGDATEAEPCEGDPTILCLDDDGPQLRNRIGSPIPNFNTASRYLLFPSFAERFDEGGPYAVLNRTATDTHGYGATLQASNTGRAVRPAESVHHGRQLRRRLDAIFRLDRDRRPHPQPRIRRLGNHRRPAGRFDHAGRCRDPQRLLRALLLQRARRHRPAVGDVRRSLQPGQGQPARPDRHCAQRRPHVQPVQSGRGSGLQDHARGQRLRRVFGSEPGADTGRAVVRGSGRALQPDQFLRRRPAAQPGRGAHARGRLPRALHAV